MTSDILKGFVDNSLSEMSHDQLRRIILALSGGNYEEIGTAVLAEKGRKGKGVDRAGDAGYGAGLAGSSIGAEENLVLGSQQKRQRVTSDDEQHNQIPASLPIDPAPRQQLETQTEIEVNDNAFNSDSTPADYQAAQTINQKIPKHCLTTMLGDTSGTTRERLWRLALIMNHLDRTQTRSRADLINSLWEGESNQQYGEDWTVESHFTCRLDLAEFVDSSVARLRKHPRFGPAYHATESTEAIGGAKTCHDHESHSTPLSSTPASSQASGSLDHAVTGVASSSSLPATSGTPTQRIFPEPSRLRTAEEDNIISGFCDAFDDIKKELEPETYWEIRFLNMIYVVNRMNSLATEMFNTTPDQLKIDLTLGLPMTKLRECMAATCNAVVIQGWWSIASKLDPGAIRTVEEELRMVDTMLQSRFKSRTFKSGIEKIRF